MPKDNEAGSALDVKMVYPPQGTSGPGATPLPNGNGYVVVPGGAQSPIVVLQPNQAPATAAQPSVVVLTVAPKEAKKDEKKEVSSVFQRL